MNRRTLLGVVALVTMVGLLLPTLAEGHGFWRWWRRPPADPVVDVTFEAVEAERGRLYQFVVSGGTIESRTRTSLEGTVLSATVAEEVLAFDPFTMVSEDGLEVTVALEPADLRTNRFGSSFRASGVAMVTPPAEEPTDPPVDPSAELVAGETVELAARVYGSIREEDDEYELNARVSGFGRFEDEEAGTREYVFLRARLEGDADVPVEPEPEPEPTPTPEPDPIPIPE